MKITKGKMVGRSSALGTVCLVMICGIPTFATTNNCPNGTTTASVNNGTVAASATIVDSPTAAVPGGNFASLGVVGCTNVDLAFSNFNFLNNNASGPTPASALTAGGTYWSSIPIGTMYNPLSTPTSVVMSTVRGTASTTGSTDNTGPNDGINNWISDSNSLNHQVNQQFAWVVNAGQAGSGLSLTSITVNVNNPGIAGTASADTIVFDLCLGGTATGIVNSSADCAGGGTFFTQTATLVTTSGAQVVTLTLPTQASRIDFSFQVLLGGGTANSGSGFDSLGFAFTEATPEPSSFVLLGSALAGIGTWRMRRFRRR